MILIIDFQGFKLESNRFIPKELAAYDGCKISHFIFKKPYSFNLLSTSLQKQVDWLINNHHCITWGSGYTPLHNFSNIIQDITKDANLIYVKGKEKAAYLKKYTSIPIIEIEGKPVLKQDVPRCFYHSKSPSVCALSNVFFIYDNFLMNE
jgi:hypothetical protein